MDLRKLEIIIIFSIFLLCSHINCQSDMIKSLLEVDSMATQFESNQQAGQINGKMQINGETYNAICDCNNVTPDKGIDECENGPKCDPSNLKIHGETAGNGASYDDIRNLVGNIEALTYAKVLTQSFKCLDGRHQDAIFGTPGGDSGEFILALMVYEDLIGGGKLLTQENVDTFFTSYLKFMEQPTFHMCTDDEAIAHLEKDLQLEGLNLKKPRSLIINRLSKKIIKPENTGDLHLKLMLKYPDRYSIRPKLIQMFIISYFKVLWNEKDDLSQKLELSILIGDHNESAFIEVRAAESCTKQQLAPLIITENKIISVFVNHLDAVSIRRAQIAKFFSDKVNHHMDAVDPVIMHDRLNHHGFVALEISGSFIAQGLPFYTINIA